MKINLKSCIWFSVSVIHMLFVERGAIASVLNEFHQEGTYKSMLSQRGRRRFYATFCLSEIQDFGNWLLFSSVPLQARWTLPRWLCDFIIGQNRLFDSFE